ncbi:MAG: nitroreductase family protein [Bacteroidetes bacterium]|nr:nitroreductase family protein [Bacteroidota bacterium]
MKKTAPTQFNIHTNARERWSPRAFSPKPVETEKLQSLFEAARWAASAFNEQPWRFIIGIKNDPSYKKILETLVEWNQRWAGQAPVLIINVAKRTFSHNGTKNGTFKYDLGQAVANLALEAVNQGLYSHQMSGFDPEKAQELFAIPEDFQAISVMAVGYYGDPVDLPADMAEAEAKPRIRKTFNELIFTETFAKTTTLF